ncbi:histidine phosphatase family protein [bacterium]|nr:histidine phosphatase family protein [bacterium]
MEWDVFISHAHEDRDAVARPLARALEALGLAVWYDENSLQLGDSLRRTIDRGLARSRYGVVILSSHFLEKEWTQGELDALFARQREGTKVILPIRHNIAHEELVHNNPMIADLLAADTSKGISVAAKQIYNVVSGTLSHISQLHEDPGLHAREVDLSFYLSNLEAEIHNNLVLELYEKDTYEDLCIAPLVAQNLGREVTPPPQEISRCVNYWRACIIGEPGSGKTTALRKLALELIAQEIPPFLPVYLSLASFGRQYTDDQCTTFGEFVDDDLSVHGAPPLAELASTQHKLLFLLDGWDEILKGTARAQVKRFLASLDHRCILTSRPEAQRSLPKCELFELQPLTPHRIREFIRLRLKDPEKVDAVVHWIADSHSMSTLARNPLNLSLITIVFTEEGNVGGLKKTKLYERAFDVILRQYYRLSPTDEHCTVTPTERRKIEMTLQGLAYEMLRRGHGRFFSERDLYAAATDSGQNVGDNFAQLLSGRLGIVRDRRSGRFEFFHLWYQELLAARQIIEACHDYVTELENENFAGILPFVIGLLRSPHEAAEALATVPIHDPFTYCRAVAEAELGVEARMETLTRVLAFGESQSPPLPTRVEMSRALVEVGEHAVEALHSIAANEQLSDYSRRASLEALVDLDSNASRLDSLLECLLETQSAGLLWHVVEHVGNRRIASCKAKLEGLCERNDPILVGDALWALGRINNNYAREPSADLTARLIALLKSEDEHIQGHALRTIGRLRIGEALPTLRQFLRTDAAPYRWIVPEAAGIIDTQEAVDLLSDCLSDRDPRVVGSAILAIGRRIQAPSEKVREKLVKLSERTEWVPHLDQTLGRSAQSVLDQMEFMVHSKSLATIYVARHCKTEWNLDHRLQGSVDLPLCLEGKKEAAAIAPDLIGLDINRIVTSSAKRAHETAEIYARVLNVPLSVSKGLREFDHGDWEGSTWEELLQDGASLFNAWMKDPATVLVPGSNESATSAQQRIVEATKTIARSYRGERVLLIAHKHILSMLQCAVQLRPLRYFSSLIDDDVAPKKLSEFGLSNLCKEIGSE